MSPRVIGALVIVFAAVLRVIGHVNSGLWFDEIWTLVDFGRLDFSTLVTTYGSDDNHPLYTLLAWLSLHTFGESAWALRLPAIVFGVLGVWMLWRFSKAVAPPAEATLATGLLLVSYHHVWFSQNARGYTALLFFTIASTHYFIRSLDGDQRAWPKYAVLLAMGIYTHITTVLVVMTHAVIWIAAWRRWVKRNDLRHTAYGLVAAPVIAVILHAPILVPKPGGEDVNVLLVWTNSGWTIRAIAESLGFGVRPGLVVLAVAAPILVVGAWSWWRRDRRLTIAFLLPGAFGAVTMLGLGPSLRPRFLFFLAGFILLLLVRGGFVIANIAARWGPSGRKVAFERALLITGSSALIVGSLAILPRAYTLPKQDYEGAMAWVRDHAGADDVILTSGLTRMPYRRYYEAPFEPIASVEELDAALVGRHRALVLHTFPAHLESHQPSLFAAVTERGREIARFAGTVRTGDIVVVAIDAVE